MPLDRMSSREGVMPREMHRRKHYPYIYYCSSCVRAYLAKEREGICKFCQGPVRMLTGGKRYIYFCEHCDLRIESDEPKMACETCGNRIMTLYRWDMLDMKEKRRIKLARFFNSFSSIRPKPRIKEQKIKIEDIFEVEELKKEIRAKKADNRKGEEMPSY
jgi:DNA-directed RNA polymerase subunit RPC12/RpoP